MRTTRFSQLIRAPLSEVYRWCTDFTDDPSLPKAPGFERILVEQSRARCVFVDLAKGPGGRSRLGVNVVILHPPDSWHLDFYGSPRGETVDFKLRRIRPGETRLDMAFKTGLSRIERPGFTALWESFARAMEREHQVPADHRRRRASS